MCSSSSLVSCLFCAQPCFDLPQAPVGIDSILARGQVGEACVPGFVDSGTVQNPARVVEQPYLAGRDFGANAPSDLHAQSPALYLLRGSSLMSLFPPKNTLARLRATGPSLLPSRLGSGNSSTRTQCVKVCSFCPENSYAKAATAQQPSRYRVDAQYCYQVDQRNYHSESPQRSNLRSHGSSQPVDMDHADERSYQAENQHVCSGVLELTHRELKSDGDVVCHPPDQHELGDYYDHESKEDDEPSLPQCNAENIRRVIYVHIWYPDVDLLLVPEQRNRCCRNALRQSRFDLTEATVCVDSILAQG